MASGNDIVILQASSCLYDRDYLNGRVVSFMARKPFFHPKIRDFGFWDPHSRDVQWEVEAEIDSPGKRLAARLAKVKEAFNARKSGSFALESDATG